MKWPWVRTEVKTVYIRVPFLPELAEGSMARRVYDLLREHKQLIMSEVTELVGRHRLEVSATLKTLEAAGYLNMERHGTVKLYSVTNLGDTSGNKLGNIPEEKK